MHPRSRAAFVGNSLPRRCGIATFTTDLQQAVAKVGVDLQTAIVAMTDHTNTYDYPATVTRQIHDANLAEYSQAADYLNSQRFDVVSLQHEFGIFGGEAGSHVLTLLSRLTMPVVSTLHTVLSDPNTTQRRVFNGIIDASSKLVVMADKASELLRTVYGVAPDKIEVIPHGIPDAPFAEPDASKSTLGFSGKSVILTFGLLSPNKGIEVMIDAMPSILRERPDAVYVVLGATHPNLVRQEGEGYRDSLISRARDRGVENHVVFLNRFVDQTTLLEFISMCDVYVTPYLNVAQMTSGTLAYSFGMGKAVVSTPYWHARELLADGRGILVPFGDAETIGTEIGSLLRDDDRRQAMRRRAYASSRSMVWDKVAQRYLDLFSRTRQASSVTAIGTYREHERSSHTGVVPPMQLSHFMCMCDDTGLFQHAVHSLPDRSHGYCIDDNARALLVACALSVPGEEPLPDVVTARFAAFVQHAWNPDAKRFRNFMGFDRIWLEEVGSEDSHGRTLWALGECAHADVTQSMQHWALELFQAALEAVEGFASPRAWAFALLGLDAYCEVRPDDRRAADLRRLLADRLLTLLAAVQNPDWVWFETGLAYDNARLPQALIATGVATGIHRYVTAGLNSLRWLMSVQTSKTGGFRPVGSDSFGLERMAPEPFDQQPLETTAAISACLCAWRAEGDISWRAHAARCFEWFLGANDLRLPLVDIDTGGCRDGLHPDRANENMGGESVVSYLLSLAEMRKLARTHDNFTDASRLSAVRA